MDEQCVVTRQEEEPVSMEIDTGAAVTILSKDVLYAHYHCSEVPKVKHSEKMLSTYTGEKIPIYDTVDVCVSAKRKSTELPLTIVSGSGTTLLGRNWLSSINLDWPLINNIAIVDGPPVLTGCAYVRSNKSTF